MQRRRAHGRYAYLGLAAFVHRNRRAGAAQPVLFDHQRPFDDVAVDAGRHTRLEGAAQLGLTAVNDHEARVAAPKGNLVAAVVPPVADEEVRRGEVVEADHARYRPPAMLADPTVEAVRLLFAGIIDRVGAAVFQRRRPLVAILERIAAHDARVAVGIGEHEDDAQLVERAVLVHEHAAAGAVPALVVVVVHEDDRLRARQQERRFAQVAQAGNRPLPEDATQLLPIAKLGHVADARVFLGHDRFAGAFNHLLKDVRLAGKLAQDGGDLVRVHMFRRVDAEAGHAEAQ